MQSGTIIYSLWRKPKVASLTFVSLKINGRQGLAPIVCYETVDFESDKFKKE